MIKTKRGVKIPLVNLFQMLTYIYPDLIDETVREEETLFDSLDEMLSELLLRGINRQLKKGLYKTYVTHEEALTMIRGKIDMHESIRLKTQLSRQLVCKFDEFDKNNFYNQVLKSTALLVIRQGRVGKKKRKKLRDMLFFFHEVDEIQLRSITWEEIRFHKDKISYRSLISLCYLIYDGIVEEEDGTYLTPLAMSDLYGRFLRYFYLKECPQLTLSYQGKSMHSIQEGATGMRSALTVDMTLGDTTTIALLNNHYDEELIGQESIKEKERMIEDRVQHLMEGLGKLKMSNPYQKVYGVFIYPSMDENTLEIEVRGRFNVYKGAMNLTIPFNKLKEQLKFIAQMERG